MEFLKARKGEQFSSNASLQQRLQSEIGLPLNKEIS